MKKLDTTNKIEFIDNNNALPNVEEEKFEEELIPYLRERERNLERLNAAKINKKWMLQYIK